MFSRLIVITLSLLQLQFCVGFVLHRAPSSAFMSLSMGITIPEEPVLEAGVVLVSQPGEHNHFLYEQAVFLYEHSVRGSKGVILERPTAFTMGEISPGIGVFEANTLYMGGEVQSTV